jgi:hypothetical protein
MDRIAAFSDAHPDSPFLFGRVIEKGKRMSTSGPNTYLFKKYLVLLNRYSPDCVVELEHIYADYGAHAGYTAALALVHFKEHVESKGEYDDPTKYIGYLRQYPSAVARLRRAFDYFIEDMQLNASKHVFRD